MSSFLQGVRKLRALFCLKNFLSFSFFKFVISLILLQLSRILSNMKLENEWFRPAACYLVLEKKKKRKKIFEQKSARNFSNTL